MADYSTFTQKSRPMAVLTGCGDDVFLITSFSGHEGISHLYNYRVEAIVTDTKIGKVDWSKLLGKDVSVVLRKPDGTDAIRYFSGICNRVAQGGISGTAPQVTHFRLEIVPKLWESSRAARSKVFHQQSVKDIVKATLDPYKIKLDWPDDNPKDKRDYCVQYRETDFNFISRLLEEEGLCYYFTHEKLAHTMCVTADTKTLSPVSPGTVEYHPGGNNVDVDDDIHTWEKMQEIRSEKYALRDYSFEKTGDFFPNESKIPDSVTVGKVPHALKLGLSTSELYDYPGEFSQRYDGIDKNGTPQPPEVEKINKDGERTALIRMQEEAAAAIVAHGSGTCRQFCAGRKFTFKAPSMDHASGDYVLTSVQHVASGIGYTSGGSHGFHYQNSFACIPEALPFRPARLTPKPVVHGTQTAVVVGNKDDEIFTDKYGRVKVQFHWDRDGKNDPDSSCWIRVATLWSGAQWGSIQIPRVGQEVVVAFEEGDPDQPIIVGSVYNDKQMPPYKLPDNKTRSGIKSRSTLKGEPKHFNELRFEDKLNSEEIYFHAERDFNRVVENNDTLKVGRSHQNKGDQTVEIFNNQTTTIGDEKCDDGSQSITVFNSQTVAIGDEKAKEGSQTITIYKDLTETIKTGNETVTIEQGNRSVNIQTGNDSLKIDKGNREVEIGMGNDTLTIKMGNQTTKLDLGASNTEAMQSITLKVGGSSIELTPFAVTIKAMTIKVEGQIQTEVKGLITSVSGDAMTTIKGGITMIN
jgi:type VI secretion system secreted protein VgrG